MRINIKWGLALLAGGAMAVFATGCASTKPAKQAVVCPECKSVVEQVGLNIPEYDPWATREERHHSCPGCQGALITLFKEGKLQHKCSICSQGPFTCSVAHATSASGSK